MDKIIATSNIPVPPASCLSLQVRTFIACTINIEYFTDTKLDGVKWNKDTFIPAATDGSLNTRLIPLAEGTLNYMKISTPTQAQRGNIYVIVDLIQSPAAASPILATLVQRYVTNISPIYVPGSNFEGSTDGQGAFESITVANPAAGAQFTQTVPTNALWRLHSIRFTFVAAVAAANRQIRVTLSRAGLVFCTFPVVDAAVTASQTIIAENWTGAGQFLARNAIDNEAFAGISSPPIVTIAGDVIASINANIQGADTYVNIYLFVERLVSM
jgi:hypothetical protein